MTQVMDAQKKASVTTSSDTGRKAHRRASSVLLSHNNRRQSTLPSKLKSITPNPPRCRVLNSLLGHKAFPTLPDLTARPKKCWNRPSALLPINRRRRTPARRSQSNGIRELVCAANYLAAFSVFSPFYYAKSTSKHAYN
jgi:hypothetical protein